MKIVNTEEYAKIRGITQQAVRKAIVNKHKLPGVLKIDKAGKYYLLTITSDNAVKKACKVA